MAKVSVIIPLFNRGHLISKTLDSVCNQDFEGWEALVVDDGSKDNGPDIVTHYQKKDPRIKLIKRDREPKGPSCCRNIGANASSGNYLVFLDSDDELAGHCLGSRYKYMDQHKDLDFAVFPLESFTEKPGDRGEVFNTYCEDKSDYLHLFLRDEAPWQTTCPIWKKDFYLKIGGFNEDFLVKTDPELHARTMLLHDPLFEVVRTNPDCYYRINYHDEVKSSYFSEASVHYRILFIRRFYQLIASTRQSVGSFKNDLAVALKMLYKNYLVATAGSRPQEYFEILNWAKKQGLIGLKNFLLLGIIGKMKQWNLPSFGIVGLCYRLIS